MSEVTIKGTQSHANKLARDWAEYNPLTWRAVYDDDSELLQINPDGSKNNYSDIDRNKLKRFDLLDDTGHPVYALYIQENQRLIYRRRTLIRWVDGEEQRALIYLVGWQMTVYTNSGPKNITAINYIFEDGSIALDGSRGNLELLNFEHL